jgi:serine/threonine protein kinase
MVWTPGQVLQGGKYTIEKRIGQGGFGITYLAKNKRGNPVVIKTLKETEQNSRDFDKQQQDFVNQALRLKGCQHPHIVKVYELIKEGNLWGIVMEYIEGETLAERAILSESEALHYIQQIGDALTFVHRNQLLHRDVKPQNIMVRADQSEAVLIDFGIAREFVLDLTLTHTANLTPSYAPPEQYNHRARWSPCTDIYALAATLYRLLTGKAPESSVSRSVGSTLTPPKQLNAQISDRVNAAIIQGMDLKPENRPQSVQEWLALLGVEQPTKPANIPPPILSLPSLPDELGSAVGIDYRKLQKLLASGKWREADRETMALMLKVFGREAEGWLKPEDINHFPCHDLCTIDQLWVKYSNGHFGFSVHYHIWQNATGQFWEQPSDRPKQYSYETYKAFGSFVGWYAKAKDDWLDTNELNFTLDAPLGHLPCGKKWKMKRMKGKTSELRVGRGWCLGGGVSSLTSRLVECCFVEW